MSRRSRVVTLGMNEGLELGDPAEPEGAMGKLGMGNRETGRLYRPGAEADDVEIEGARAPPHQPLAPALDLDRLAMGQERLRCQRRLEQDHLVQVPVLRYRAEGR